MTALLYVHNTVVCYCYANFIFKFIQEYTKLYHELVLQVDETCWQLTILLLLTVLLYVHNILVWYCYVNYIVKFIQEYKKLYHDFVLQVEEIWPIIDIQQLKQLNFSEI